MNWKCRDCGSNDYHFSRTLCACGSAHDYCNDCGLQVQFCRT
jgi:ribosomal protein L37E